MDILLLAVTEVTPPKAELFLVTTLPLLSINKTLVSLLPPGTLLIVTGTLKSIELRVVDGIVKAADSVELNEIPNKLADEPDPSGEEPDNAIVLKIAFEAVN
jgi:hypothetical protein